MARYPGFRIDMLINQYWSGVVVSFRQWHILAVKYAKLCTPTHHRYRSPDWKIKKWTVPKHTFTGKSNEWLENPSAEIFHSRSICVQYVGKCTYVDMEISYAHPPTQVTLRTHRKDGVEVEKKWEIMHIWILAWGGVGGDTTGSMRAEKFYF